MKLSTVPKRRKTVHIEYENEGKLVNKMVNGMEWR